MTRIDWRFRLNDSDREDWIDNDEGLYDWWRSSRVPKARFIKENRPEIDAVIHKVRTGAKPAHYLKYGPDHAYEPGPYGVCRRCGESKHRDP